MTGFPFCFLVLLSSALSTHSEEELKSKKEAYVTFVREDVIGSVVGVRVLGQSLRETGTKKDCVVICNKDTTSAATIDILLADGWIVKFTQELLGAHDLQPIDSKIPTHFLFPFEKLIAWRMTGYTKLALIGPDFIVSENIDYIFSCGSFCATYTSSDGKFDTGVMIIQPSELTYEDMLEKSSSSKMKTEDLFLNEYFNRLIYATMFNWKAPEEHKHLGFARLPSCFNADATTYYLLNSRWVIEEKRKITRFSAFGCVYPWEWKFYFLFDLHWEWNKVRQRLPYNMDDNRFYEQKFPLWGPLLLVLFCCLAAFSFVNINILKMPTRLKPFTKNLHQHMISHRRQGTYPTYSFIFIVLSYYFTFKLIPTTLMPNQAEVLLFLWSCSIYFTFLGLYAFIIHALGTVKGLCDPVHSLNLTARLDSAMRHGRKHRLRRRWTLVLFLMYFSTFILLRIIPRFIHLFKTRVCTTLILLVVHLFVSCKVGHDIMQLWSK